MRIIIPVLLVFFSYISAGAQVKDCLDRIKAYNDKMSGIGFPEKNQTYYFHYVSQMEYRETGNQASPALDIKVMMSRNQIHYITNEVEIYQDTVDAFMIVPSQKLVLWSASSLHQDKESKLNTMIHLRDTLLSRGKIETCEKVMVEGKNQLKAKFGFDAATSKIHNINSVTYWYDLKSERIVKTYFEFTAQHELKNATMIFKEMNLKYPVKLDKPVASVVIRNGRQLLPRFSGYQLIDNRNN